MVHKEAKGRVNSQGEWEEKRMPIIIAIKWDRCKTQLVFVSYCVYLQPPQCSLSAMQVLVSWTSQSFLQCMESILQASRTPKNSHCALPLSLIIWLIPRWDIWEAKQHRKLCRWKIHRKRRKMFRNLPICFVSKPWGLMRKQPVCLFVLW